MWLGGSDVAGTRDDSPRPTDLGPIDEARRALYERLRAAPPEVLTTRPASGDWSVIENVRHLLYAERRHFGRLLPKGFAWDPIGLPTGGVPRRTGAGTASTDDLEEVLAAWDQVHGAIRLDAVEREQAIRAVERNLLHLRIHMRYIGRTLG